MSEPSPTKDKILLSDPELDIHAYINQEMTASLAPALEDHPNAITTEEKLAAVDRLRASVQLQVRDLSKEMAQCQRDWAQTLPEIRLEVKAIEARALALSQRASRLGVTLGALDLSVPRENSSSGESTEP